MRNEVIEKISLKISSVFFIGEFNANNQPENRYPEREKILLSP